MGDRNTLLFGSVFVLATAAIAADHVAHAPRALPPVVSSPAGAAGNPCSASANPCAAGNPCSAGNPCAAGAK
jgi:hypothetical protein